MPEFPIDSPTDAIVQVAYAVPDLHEAISWWVKQGVGPWFVWERLGKGTIYRGQPTDAELSLAIAYSGPMMFELIQALDDEPSAYKEARERNGYGFHHVAKMRANVKQLAESYEAKGQPIVARAPVPGGEVFFVDGGKGAPGMIELIEDNAQARKLFEAIWRASIGWNGEQPVRSLMDLLEGH